MRSAAGFEAAFAHYAEGNRAARPRRSAIDADETAAFVRRSKALFTPAFFAARAGQGCPAPDPIFILGMPRAGSTLVEQILASHSLVEGHDGAARHSRARAAARRQARHRRRPLSRMPRRSRRARRCARWAQEYLERTRIQRKTGRPYFIDKMPNNWAHAGLIRLILPNAKIIDARRHPLDCCFSNFKQHFARGQAFSYSLDDMGRYYADYVRLMAHLDARACRAASTA